MNKDIAQNINILGSFLGKRDLDVLSSDKLFEKFGFPKADVMVLFGGSILAGGDVLGKAIKNKVAKSYVIVGGAGHTTETLRQIVNSEFPEIETKNLTEAVIFQNYLKSVYGVQADYLETESTNCGNNITLLLELLKREGVSFSSIILCQDATMQSRMDAVLRKYVSTEVKIINYATYKAEVCVADEKLIYKEKIRGMWNIDRYVNLLMGEIPRLKDDENGYGPKGKNYLVHVDIPSEVLNAFEELKKVFGEETRVANPLFASKA